MHLKVLCEFASLPWETLFALSRTQFRVPPLISLSALVQLAFLQLEKRCVSTSGKHYSVQLVCTQQRTNNTTQCICELRQSAKCLLRGGGGGEAKLRWQPLKCTKMCYVATSPIFMQEGTWLTPVRPNQLSPASTGNGIHQWSLPLVCSSLPIFLGDADVLRGNLKGLLSALSLCPRIPPRAPS